MTDKNFSVKNGIVVNTAFTANSTAVVANGISVNSTGTYVSGTVNSTSYSIGSSFVANTTALVANGISVNSTGTYVSGTVNSTSYSIGSSFVANSTGTYVSGTVNSASYTVGSSFVANSTVLNTTGSLSAANLTTTTSVATIGTSTYFVSNNNIGINTSSPICILDIAPDESLAAGRSRIRLADTKTTVGGTGSYPSIEIMGARGDGNQTFGGRVGVSFRRADNNYISSGGVLGWYAFGGQSDNTSIYNSANVLYSASIAGVADGTWSNATNMPIALSFRTGLVGENLNSVNKGYGSEKVRVSSNGYVGIGTSAPDALLKVAADANVTGNVVIGGSLTAANVTASLFTGNVTGTSSNATNLNNQPGSYYTNATNISTGTLVDARLSANYNTGTALTANNANYLGTIPASSYVNSSQLSANLSNYLLTYNGTVNGAIYQTGGGLGSVANGVYVNATSIFVGNSSVNVSINATSFSGTSSNATNLNNQPGSYYTNATNITTGTLPWGQAPAGTVNTSGNFTVSGNINFTAANNVINATSHTVGSSFVANSTVLNTTGSLSSANLTTTTNVATIGTSSYFVSNGNVGVGTSTPTYKLDVTGTVRTGNLTANVVSTGATSSRTLSTRFAEKINVRDFGAVGDGSTDDSAAFANAISYINTNYNVSAGNNLILYIPTGNYVLTSNSLPSFTKQISVQGEGKLQSILKVSNTYVGNVFSWNIGSGVLNYGFTFAGNTVNFSQLNMGVNINDFSIVGDRTSTGEQNALVFYDAMNNVVANEIDIYYMPGRALYLGKPKSLSNGWIQESSFKNLRFYNCGIKTGNVFTIDVYRSGETYFENIDIYAPRGGGMKFDDAHDITLKKIRIEGLENIGAGVGLASGDLLLIGNSNISDTTRLVSGFYADQLDIINPYAGYAAIRISAYNSTSIPVDVSLKGVISGTASNNGKGLVVEAGRNLFFNFVDISTTDTNITIGAYPMIGTNILIDGSGSESRWTYNIDSSVQALVATPARLFGNPNTGVSDYYGKNGPGNLILPGPVTVNGTITLANTVTVNGAITSSNTLTVNNLVTLANTTIVSGGPKIDLLNASFGSYIFANNNLYIGTQFGASYPISFLVSNDTKATIAANGNFGIGTTTPDALLKVTGAANVSGNVAIGGNLTVSGVSTHGTPTFNGIPISSYSNNNVAIYASSNSSYGIYATSTYAQALYGISVSSYGVVGISNTGIGSYGYSNSFYGLYGWSNTFVGVVARSTSGNPLIAGNTTSDLFGVYANGNIGIGSSSPPTTLHINAGGYAGIMLGTNDATGIVLTKEVSDNSFNIWQGSYGISGVSRFKLDVNGNIKLTGNTFVVANSSAVNTFGVYANGNIGIGTSSPPYNVSVQGSPNATIHLSDGTVRGGVSSNTPVSGAFYVGSYSSHPLTIGTVNAERMRIDTSGNVGIGTSSPSYKLDVSGDIRSTANVSGNNSTFVKSFIGSSTDTSGVQNIRFGFGSAGIGSYYNNVDTLGSLLHPLWFITNGATVGHISVDGSSTYYMSSSDYRLKTNVKPLVSGLNTINSLKPVSYTWIKNNQQGEGFIAHELQEIIPLAVSGQKDAVDDQGNIVAQGIDPSKLVVHLVVSIQELSQKIEDLTAKLKSSGIEV